MGKKLLSTAVAVAALLLAGTGSFAHAQSGGGFSVQVSPSPIVESIKPGVTKTVEVKIRNQNTQKETLKMSLRAFSVNPESGEVNLENQEPQDVASWTTFENQIFEVDAGQWYTQKVTFAVPQDAGFTYSFAIVVSRANPTKEAGGKTAVEGSVAIFTLLSTERTGAVRKLEIASFSSAKKVYEYLPTSFSLKLKNSGNTIVQPAGNIYIQRSSTSQDPISLKPVNEKAAYILPGVQRTLTTEWVDGFPAYKTDASTQKKHLVWDWSKLQNIRLGHYVAKVVVVYNDGTRDVPVEALVDFWVIPWKLLSIIFLAIVLIIIGIVTIVRKGVKLTKKKSTDVKKEE